MPGPKDPVYVYKWVYYRDPECSFSCICPLYSPLYSSLHSFPKWAPLKDLTNYTLSLSPEILWCRLLLHIARKVDSVSVMSMTTSTQLAGDRVGDEEHTVGKEQTSSHSPQVVPLSPGFNSMYCFFLCKPQIVPLNWILVLVSCISAL